MNVAAPVDALYRTIVFKHAPVRTGAGQRNGLQVAANQRLKLTGAAIMVSRQVVRAAGPATDPGRSAAED
jgi:hypothetical protein